MPRKTSKKIEDTKSHSNSEILGENTRKSERPSRVIQKPQRYRDLIAVSASCKITANPANAKINIKLGHVSSSKKYIPLVKNVQNRPTKRSAANQMCTLRNSKRHRSDFGLINPSVASSSKENNIELMKNKEGLSGNGLVTDKDRSLPVNKSALNQVKITRNSKKHHTDCGSINLLVAKSTMDDNIAPMMNKEDLPDNDLVTDKNQSFDCRLPVDNPASNQVSITRNLKPQRTDCGAINPLVANSTMEHNIDRMMNKEDLPDNGLMTDKDQLFDDKPPVNNSASKQVHITKNLKRHRTDCGSINPLVAKSTMGDNIDRMMNKEDLTDNDLVTDKGQSFDCRLPVNNSASNQVPITRNLKRQRTDCGSINPLVANSTMKHNIDRMMNKEDLPDNGLVTDKDQLFDDNYASKQVSITKKLKRHRTDCGSINPLVAKSTMDDNIDRMMNKEDLTDNDLVTDKGQSFACRLPVNNSASNQDYGLMTDKDQSCDDKFQVINSASIQVPIAINSKRRSTDCGSINPSVDRNHLFVIKKCVRQNTVASFITKNIEVLDEDFTDELCNIRKAKRHRSSQMRNEDNGSSSEEETSIVIKNFKRRNIGELLITENIELVENHEDLAAKRENSSSGFACQSTLTSRNKKVPCVIKKSRQQLPKTTSLNRSSVYNEFEFVNVEPEYNQVGSVENLVESDPMNIETDNHDYEMVPEFFGDEFEVSVPMSWSTENEHFESIITDDEDLVSTDDETIPAKRTRNRKPDKSTWKREITKTKREQGESYEGYERKREPLIVPLKEKWNVTHSTRRPERTIGPRCSSVRCIKSTNRQCNMLSKVERVEMHRLFWKEMSWDQKKIFIAGLVDVGSPKKRIVANSKRRAFKYFIKIENERKQVCKSFFLSTFSLKQWMVRHWISTSINGIIPTKANINAKRAATRPISQLQQSHYEKKDFLLKFLHDLPKLPSHYCRKRTKKIYLEPNYHTKAQLYEHYTIVCKENNVQSLSTCYFSNMFMKMNLGLYQPKKDRCDMCIGYEKGNIDVQQYNNHIRLKKRARKEKKLDKRKARASQAHVFVMDVQAVQLAPFSNASALYFKTKLKVHNFTIFNLATKECTCYWWHEGDGEMCAEMFVTCILKHLRLKCTDRKPIILWSDGCVYQNRNQILSNALLDHAIEEDKVIEQKYLVKGHTQMEVDNIHALIERKIKKRSIDLPTDYVKVTMKARKKLPIEAELLTYNDFLKYDDPSLYRYNSIRPGNKVKDPTVTDLHVLTYNPDGTIGYKINFNDELKLLPRLPKIPQHNYSEIQPAYLEPLKISKRRFNDLQDLKLILPEIAHSFYDSLCHE